MIIAMKTHLAQKKIILILAFTQIVSWGSLYYAFAVLATDMQRELGWRAEMVFGAFSWSLLVAGLVATPVGILLDRHGGRAVMGSGSLLAGAGLIALGCAQSLVHYYVAWTVLGAGMAMVMYEAAFATINREFAYGARQAISTVSLAGGLASTVFWPLTLKLNGLIGWRETYMAYGAVHILLCAPLHALLAPGQRPAAVHADAEASVDYTLHQALRDPIFWKLALAFATNSFIFSGVAVYLIPLLQQFGHSLSTVVMLAALIGPLQVLGRIGEMAFANRILPQTVGKITFSLLPLALLTLLVAGDYLWAVVVFCIGHGLSNGIITIVRGTVPRTLFGSRNYGAIAGALSGPGLLAKAAGPLAVAAIAERSSSPYVVLGVLLVIALVSLGFYLGAVKVNGGR